MKIIRFSILVLILLTGCSADGNYEVLEEQNTVLKSEIELLRDELNTNNAVYEESINDLKRDNLKLEEQINNMTTKLMGSQVLKNPFLISDARVNDWVEGMIIKNIVSDGNGAYIEFEGTQVISGKYEHHEGDESFPTMVVFYPNDKSTSKLPRIVEDNRTVWLGFDSDIKNDFGEVGTEGYATIVIDEYSIDSFPSATWNTANLIAIIEIDEYID